jgi:prepilin-type N-terminal cleavage/methylation domain-containing protein
MKFSKGFTLIEVIATVVIMAIAAAALVSIFGELFYGSAVPVGQVQKQYKLIQQMETITSRYRDQVTKNTSFSLSTFKSEYVDGQDYVDSANTGLITLTSSDSTYTTGNVLKVTLTDGTQTLVSIFTQ